jgi:hypothetical protein
MGFLFPRADLSTAPVLALRSSPEPKPNFSGAPEVELPPVETPEYESVPFGEPSRPSSLDMELDIVSEDPSMLTSPHDLVDYHFFLMESVSVSAGQGGGRCPSDFFCPDLVFHGSEPFSPFRFQILGLT